MTGLVRQQTCSSLDPYNITIFATLISLLKGNVESSTILNYKISEINKKRYKKWSMCKTRSLKIKVCGYYIPLIILDPCILIINVILFSVGNSLYTFLSFITTFHFITFFNCMPFLFLLNIIKDRPKDVQKYLQ